MSILDIPPELTGGPEQVTIGFRPRTWKEFDKTVCWLVTHGVPLQYRDKDHYTLHHIVAKRGRPYANGMMVTRRAGTERYEGYVSGMELSAQYTVWMPEEQR